MGLESVDSQRLIMRAIRSHSMLYILSYPHLPTLFT